MDIAFLHVMLDIGYWSIHTQISSIKIKCLCPACPLSQPDIRVRPLKVLLLQQYNNKWQSFLSRLTRAMTAPCSRSRCLCSEDRFWTCPRLWRMARVRCSSCRCPVSSWRGELAQLATRFADSSRARVTCYSGRDETLSNFGLRHNNAESCLQFKWWLIWFQI